MKTNPLGDIRAEYDHEMLDRAFYETPEYRSLIEEHTRHVVVGRRGTGKSALFYRLQRHWLTANKTTVIELTPSETDVIGLRPFVSHFGEKASYLRAACTIAWQYAILLEIITVLEKNYKVRSETELKNLLPSIVRVWLGRGDSIVSRLFNALEEKVDISKPIEKRVSSLAQALDIGGLTDIVIKALDVSRNSLNIVADRLDEGYEPDLFGVAILTGLVYAFEKISSAVPRTATTLFLRDNIFRSIQHFDLDYSRNIEGDVLRLHWDEYHLFNMICSRLRAAFSITIENNLRVWNSVTARDIKGKDGFHRCLRLTLYRPRDLLVLLNNAFYHARSHDRDIIVNEDIEVAARQISCTRLDDLKKEYSEVIPGIAHLLSLFANNKPELSLEQVTSLIDSNQFDEKLGPAEGQTLAIIKSPAEIIHTLFSVGFLGVWNCTTSSYVFCHDGKDPDFAVDSSSKVLIHPCYWIALNIEDRPLPTEVDDIHDDYDIEVRSETPEIRKRKVGLIISQLNTISEGGADAPKFEKWCLEAIRIVFAGGIVNIESHPNKTLTQRRDIVGRNTEGTETWKRILKDYQTRQVVFEVKNYSKDLGPDEYRQMQSYLCGEYGRLGFIINRSKDANLHKERELQWVREIYHEHKKVVVKIPCTLIVKWLSKLRNPQKHDAPDKGLGALLDSYERSYLRLGNIKKGKETVTTTDHTSDFGQNYRH